MINKNPFRYFKTSHEVIQFAIMMCVRFQPSLHDVEDLRHERGVDVCHESIRLWVDHEGEVLEIYVTKKLNKTAALKFLRKAMNGIFNLNLFGFKARGTVLVI